MTLAEVHLGESGGGVGEGVEATFHMMGGLEVSELGAARVERQAAGFKRITAKVGSSMGNISQTRWKACPC